MTNLTKANSQGFYKEQGTEVLQVLKHAYIKGENNQMILLARSKQTLHSFLNAATEEIKQVLSEEKDGGSELKVIRVNSILSNSETKILLRLGEALKLK